MSSDKKTVLIGVSGGIAAYKAVDCASKLSQAGYSVHVVMSPGALEFVRPLTFAAVTQNPVIDNIFPSSSSARGEELFPHIYPASNADLFILVPASADMLAKIAHGFADDPVCAAALTLSKSCKKLFCPAMHVNMWSNGAVRKNAVALVDAGWVQLGPVTGTLACGAEGEGRMVEPLKILETLKGLTQ